MPETTLEVFQGVFSSRFWLKLLTQLKELDHHFIWHSRRIWAPPNTKCFMTWKCSFVKWLTCHIELRETTQSFPPWCPQGGFGPCHYFLWSGWAHVPRWPQMSLKRRDLSERTLLWTLKSMFSICGMPLEKALNRKREVTHLDYMHTIKIIEHLMVLRSRHHFFWNELVLLQRSADLAFVTQGSRCRMTSSLRLQWE